MHELERLRVELEELQTTNANYTTKRVKMDRMDELLYGEQIM
jgi:hypothetical protein